MLKTNKFLVQSLSDCRRIPAALRLELSGKIHKIYKNEKDIITINFNFLFNY